MSLPVRISAFVLCAAAGFVAARSSLPKESSTTAAAPPARAAAPSGEIPVPTLTAEASAMIAEWERLRAQHGGASPDLGALYLSVKDLDSSFRRRTYRSAIMAEWAKSDPAAALKFLLEKDGGNARQLLREWMRNDPQAAIAHLMNGDEKMRKMLTDILSDVAESAPARLVEILSRAPKAESRWDRTAQNAFAIFAKKDPEAARAAAQTLTGPWRSQAFAGIATAWGEKDGPAALAWAQALPAGEDRDAALKATLIGWAKTNPTAALENIDAAPPGGDESYYASDVGAQVLGEAAKKDWDGTLRWLKDHPGKLGRSSMDGLTHVLSLRLNADVAGTMRTIAESGADSLQSVFGNAIINDAYVQREAVWAWLEAQPPGGFVSNARLNLINAMAWKEPGVAMEFLEQLPDNAANRGVFENGTRSLVNGGTRMDVLEEMLTKASPKLRPHLIEAGITFNQGTMSATPQKWIERINELPADRRLDGYAGLARAWARSDPEAALEWAQKLGTNDSQQGILGSVVGTWAGSDPDSAAAWVNKLPPGGARDRSSGQLAMALVQSQPEAAWEWAASIQDPRYRMDTLRNTYTLLSAKDPARAAQLINKGNLTNEERESLRTPGETRAGSGTLRPPF